jgi:uncharacterized protein YjiS (DUF1127 family)
MTGTTSNASTSGGGRKLPPERGEMVKAAARTRAHSLQASMIRDFGRWLARRPANLLRRLQAWRMRRAAIRDLQQLDNRMLHDLGIARSEIEYLVSGGDPERRVPRAPAIKRTPCVRPAVSRSDNGVIERHAA